MKKFLLPEHGTFYKANLHCHSTFSDGRYTPEQIKELYKKHGYSIVAYTDHDVLIPHDELKDENFLPLHGYEMEVDEPIIPPLTRSTRKTCHICFIGIKENNIIQACYHRTKFMPLKSEPNRHLVKFDDSLPDFERVYTPECINEIIKISREKGFFVTYNHPVWSLEGYPQYINYHGMNAMEICNYGCIAGGYDDYAPQIYDDMLRNGERIFCTATDDNHNRREEDDPQFDSCGGFVQIKADKLEYETITKALVDGNFYASQGPSIYELYIEDNAVHIKCSPAQKIVLTTGIRKANAVFSKGELLTEAVFPIIEDYKYFRLTVVGPDGKPANTNAYFCDEVLK